MPHCTNNSRRPGMMRAIVLEEPGPVENLLVCERPIPPVREGWVRVQVKAFGLNRSELHTRLGLADPDVTFPRVLGIEATGVVDADPSGTYVPGQQVVTLMGGMGRSFDGGYAEYTLVPVGQVVPFESDLDWSVLGAVPEMLQTAYGSLTIGLDLQPGHTLLVRGGTSSVGMAAALLAKQAGARVLATTRSPAKAQALTEFGVDHVVIDDGEIAHEVRALVPGGVDAALELVGTPTLQDTLRSTRVHGTVCFTGMLSNQWTVPDFYPIDYIPRGVRLTSYAGGAADLPPNVLQGFLDDVAAGRFSVPVDSVYELEQIQQAHQRMEDGGATGKMVVLTGL